MGNTKAALKRYLFYNKCLRNNMRNWSRDYLLETVNEYLRKEFGIEKQISKSTLLQDIVDMKDILDAPIGTKPDGSHRYYHYTRKNYSILDLPLEEMQLRLLKKVLGISGKALPSGLASKAGEIVNYLEQKYEYEEEPRELPVEFEASGDVEGMEYFDDILDAADTGKALSLTYNPMHSDDTYVWVIHPYLLKQYKGLWYVLCWVEARQGLRVLRLDRIRKLTSSDHLYRQPAEECGPSYFNDVIGVTVYPHEEVQDVELVFAPTEAAYIKRIKLHHSQKIIHDYPNGNLHIRMRLKINPELKMVIQSYARKVTVLKPQRLADEINQALDNEVVRFE
jgi:predicted DNA-binding transcriptional regulator YafY